MSDRRPEDEQLKLLANGYVAGSPYDVPLPDEMQLWFNGVQGLVDKAKASPVGQALRRVKDYAASYTPGQLGRDVLGALDTGATMAQNIAASAPAGWAGMAGGVADVLRGNDNLETAQRWQEAVQRKLGNAPVTPEGQWNTQQIAKGAHAVFEQPGEYLYQLGVPPILLLGLDQALAMAGPGEAKAGLMGVKTFIADAAKAGVAREAVVQALHERGIIPHATMLREAGLDAAEGPMQGPMRESAAQPFDLGGYKHGLKMGDLIEQVTGLAKDGASAQEIKTHLASLGYSMDDVRSALDHLKSIQAKTETSVPVAGAAAKTELLEDIHALHQAGMPPDQILRKLRDEKGVPPGDFISAWRTYQNEMALREQDAKPVATVSPINESVDPTSTALRAPGLADVPPGAKPREVGPPPNDFTPKQEKSAALRSQEDYNEALKNISPKDAADLTNAGMWLHPDPVNGGILGAPPGFTEKAMPKLDARIAALADLGKKGAPWYWNTRAVLTRMTDNPEMAGKLAGVQAAVSPQVPVPRAADLGMNYWNRRVALGPKETRARGKEFPTMKETIDSSNRVMEGGDPGGPKRDSFATNMRPNSPPQGRITVDAHMMDGYGYKTKAPSDPQYVFVTGHQNHLFDRLKNGDLKEKYPELAAGLREPMDLQAATWVGVRIEKALKGRKWESLSPQEQRAIQLKAQEDYESLADNTRMHVVHEDTPATAAQDRGHATGFNELSNEKKRAYQQLVNPERDPAATAAGLVAEPRKNATGTWTDEGGTHENPLNVTAVHGGTAKGTLATDPHSQDAGQFVALMHGYPKAQAMVPVSRTVTDLSKSTSKTANALRAFEGPGAADDVKNALELKIKEHNEALPRPLWPNHELTLEQTGDGSYTVSGNWGQASPKEFAEHGAPIAEALRKPKRLAPREAVEDRFGTGDTREVFRMPEGDDVNIRPARRETLPGSELDWSKLTPEGSGEVTDQWVDQLKPIKARSPGLFSAAEKNWSPMAKYLRTLNEVENNPWGAFPKAHPAMTKAREVLAQMGPKRFVEWWDGLSPEAKKASGLPVVALAGAEIVKQLNQEDQSGN